MTDKSGNILVVDDNEMNRDMLSRRLIRRGHSVLVAKDGSEAIELVKENHFDVVLLDIMMPEIDGLEVLKILRRDFSVADLPIIMVTAKEGSSDVVQALEFGANDYVTKPIDFAVLHARLQTQISLKRLTETKDQFLRIASHDLKSPLSLILGAAATVSQMIPVGAELTEDLVSLLARIHVRATEMQKIIEDFLDFQALEDGRLETSLEPVDLNKIGESIVEANIPYATDKQVVLVCDSHQGLPTVSAEPGRMRQIAQNLVGNAIKFSPPGSEVCVRTRVEGQTVLFEVRDTGPGLTDRDLEKVFTKYARMSNSPTGGEKSSGLGLYICKQLIDLHGGKIGVHNNPDLGATFWFSLPNAKP